MAQVCMNRSVGLTDEEDDGDNQALDGKADLYIPERSLQMVLVSLPDPPPGEIEKQVEIKKGLPVSFQKRLQSISPLPVFLGGRGIVFAHRST
jgi:hypothetical protein